MARLFLLRGLMAFLLIEFFICAGVIVYSGTQLSRYGDVIAEKTGLGRAWIGLVLMAGVTSLPELINGISSVALAHVPDIAAGDIMGSCMFNLLLIAMMDFLNGREPVLSKAGQGHAISAGFGIMLIGIAVVSILSADFMPAIAWAGVYTPVIIAVYLLGIRSVYVFEKGKKADDSSNPEVAAKAALLYPHVSLRRTALHYCANAAVIVAAATALPFIGDRVAGATGLGGSFVGTFLIGITTSLPEAVVSIAAMRIGAVDMAVGNIFGSNMFNIAILAVDDIFYSKGPLLSDVAASHAVAGVIAMVMTGIALAGLVCRAGRKPVFRLGWDSMGLVAAFIVSVFVLYSMRGA